MELGSEEDKLKPIAFASLGSHEQIPLLILSKTHHRSCWPDWDEEILFSFLGPLANFYENMG